MIRRKARRGGRALLLAALLVLVAEVVLSVASDGGLFHAAGRVGEYVPYVGYVTGSDPQDDDAVPPGFRRSWEPDGDGPSVWMFGGSTLAGGYTSNPGQVCEPNRPCTIASWLARRFDEAGAPRRVWNLGQHGYRLTQERILFEELLARHEAPEWAVFYDGANETQTGAGLTGYPHHYEQFHDDLEWLLAGPRLRRGLSRSRSKLAFLFHYLFNSRGESAPIRAFRSLSTVDPAAPEDEARGYAHNVRILSLLCGEFGVRCLFLWQPVLCDKARPTGALEEAHYSRVCGEGGAAETAESVRHKMAEVPAFHDLSGLFAEESGVIFMDQFHVDEAGPGNQRIAEAIFEILTSPR